MASEEGLTLGGMSLSDRTTYRLQGLEMPPPKKRIEWATGADSDGSGLIRNPLFENRIITARIRITQQATMDAALDAIHNIEDKIEEAELQENGLAMVWTPATSARTMTFYVLSGEIEDIPRAMDGSDFGYFQFSPVVTVRFECKPFGYGAEYEEVAATASSLPMQEIVASGVPGDVEAEGRLVVTDTATQNRRHVEWGLESRHYSAANSLILDSDGLTTSGFAGTGTTRTGAYDPGGAGNNVVRATLTTSAVAVVGTGNLAHIGTYRVKARVWATSLDVRVRFSWRDGDGPLQANGWTTPQAEDGFVEVDLGEISLTTALSGTQRWSGQIEAKSATVADTIDVDYILLIPTERYGVARTPQTLEIPSVFSARDEFDQTAGALTGKTLPVGGTWTFSAGDTDDYTVDATNRRVQRITTSDTAARRVYASTPTALTNVAVRGDCDPGTNTVAASGLIFRLVDANNYCIVYVQKSSATLYTVDITKVKAGVGTSIGPLSHFSYTGVGLTLAAVAFATGVVTLYAAHVGALLGAPLWTIFDTDLATGGTHASGGVGLYDLNATATAATRTIDNFTAWVPSVEAVAFASQSVEFRSADTIREDSGGTVYGRPKSYRGSRLFVPPAGDANRSTRIAVKSRRNDVTVESDPNIADAQTVALHLTPRYLSVKT